MPSEHRKAYMANWWSTNQKKKSKYNKDFFKRRAAAFESGEIQRATEKRCPLCDTVKPASEFYKSNTNKDGLHGWCKLCSDRRTVENGRKRMYGVDPAKFDKILEDQNWSCAICGVDQPTAGKKSFCLDHNHATGERRGILCTRCNTLIGNALDSVTTLKAAIAYLERYNEDECKEKE